MAWLTPARRSGRSRFFAITIWPLLRRRVPRLTRLRKGHSYREGRGRREGRTLLVVGNLLLDVASEKSRVAAADVECPGAECGGPADRRPYPPIAEFLPKDGLVPGSERYVLGPLSLSRHFRPAPPLQLIGPALAAARRLSWGVTGCRVKLPETRESAADSLSHATVCCGPLCGDG